MSNGQRARDIAALAAYQLRPLRPGTLVAGVLAVSLAGWWMIPGQPPPPPELLALEGVALPLALIAMTLGIGVAFVVGRDVDAAEPLLGSVPYPYWVTIALRACAWGVASMLVIALLAARGAGALDITAGGLRSYGIALFLFTASFAIACARLMGSLFGGGAALVLMIVLGTASIFVDPFPLRLLAMPGSRAFSETLPLLWFASAAVAFIALRAVARPASKHRVTLAP